MIDRDWRTTDADAAASQERELQMREGATQMIVQRRREKMSGEIYPPCLL